jgi:hypothetical protein
MIYSDRVNPCKRKSRVDAKKNEGTSPAAMKMDESYVEKKVEEKR